MADNKTIDNGVLTDFTAATDEIAGVDYQYVKLVDGTPDSTAKIAGDATNGLDVDVTRLPALVAGDAVVGRVKISDGTTLATVRDLAANDALNVAIVDGAGNQVTSFGGSGGTSSSDDADFTPLTTPGTPAMGVYEPVPTSVTADDMGIVGITQTRAMKVSLEASSLDVAADDPDTGAPVKIGAQGRNALPTAVANADRANSISDLFGRLLTSHIDPAMQAWRGYNTTTQATGAVVWDPAAGKRIAITSIVIGTYGTTAARLILWFGDTADTVYTAGTDQLVLAASFAPSTTAKPGLVFTPASPVFSTTADRELHITTDAALSVDVAVNGYEW